MYLFIYIFGCAGSLLLCTDYSVDAGHRLLIAESMSFSTCSTWAQQLRFKGPAYGLCCCGTVAQLLCSVWSLPRPGIKPMSPALARGFLSTIPLRKSETLFFVMNFFLSLKEQAYVTVFIILCNTNNFLWGRFIFGLLILLSFFHYSLHEFYFEGQILF